jgi:CRP-like cAMP-binding protein
MPVTYEKGAVIFIRGSAADLVFWLLKGFAKLYLPQENGDRTLVDLGRGGDILSFATETNSTGRHHLLEAHAATKCTVGLLSFDHLLQILSALDQRTAARVLESLNTAWSTAFERYITFVGSSFRKRLEIVIGNLGTRFGINEKRGILLVPELSHEDLAEMIGSSRPMVSKLIGDMLQEGVLVRGERRHFIVRTPVGSSVTTDHQQPAAIRGSGINQTKRFSGNHLTPSVSARG